MLYYISENPHKIAIARKHLTRFGIQFQTKKLKLTEVQSENIHEIARYKTEQAFDAFKRPLFTTDHGWSITALNGFPGAYMKYVNKWLTADDFLRLMKGKQNREVILTEVICYTDGLETKTFTACYVGKILDKPQGSGIPGTTMFSLSQDGISIARKLELNQNNVAVEDFRTWQQFADWYKSHKA